MPTSEALKTKQELGQYLKSIPRGAKEVGAYNGAKIYEYKGVHIRGGTKNQPKIEAYHPYSTMSKDIRAGKPAWKPSGQAAAPAAAAPEAAAKPAAKPAAAPAQAPSAMRPEGFDPATQGRDPNQFLNQGQAASPAQSLTDLAAQGVQGTTGAAGAAGPTGATASPGAKTAGRGFEESEREKGSGFLGQSLGGGVPGVLDPQMITVPGSAGINDAGRQNALMQHFIESLRQRQSRALHGAIPGQKGSDQGERLGRLSPEEMIAQAGGGGAGGWGIIKEPGVLGQLLAMADASAKERQAATQKQYDKTMGHLGELRKYVSNEVPDQLATLMANYKGLSGDMKTQLEDNLTKLSEEGGRIGEMARAVMREDVNELSKALNVPAAEIQTMVSKATESVLPGVGQRGQTLGQDYKDTSTQEILAQSESKEEAEGIVGDVYGGRKLEIERSFDEQIQAAKDQQEGSVTNRGLSGTTLASVDTSKIRNLKAQQQSALNQLADMAAQAKVGAINMWEQGKASARQMFDTGRLGAQQATGSQIGQIASGFAGQGLQGTMGLMGEKMSGIGAGYRNMMNLGADMAGKEFGAQATGRQQIMDMLGRIGLQGTQAEQRGTEFQGMREQDLGFKQADTEAGVQHVGNISPELLMSLAERLGSYSQLGEPAAGNMGVGGQPGLPGLPGPPGGGGGGPAPGGAPGGGGGVNINNTFSLGNILGGLGSMWGGLTSPTGQTITNIGGPVTGAPATGGAIINHIISMIQENPETAMDYIQGNPEALWPSIAKHLKITLEQFKSLSDEDRQLVINGQSPPIIQEMQADPAKRGARPPAAPGVPGGQGDAGEEGATGDTAQVLAQRDEQFAQTTAPQSSTSTTSTSTSATPTSTAATPTDYSIPLNQMTEAQLTGGISQPVSSISGITNNQAAPTAAPATSLGGLVGPAVAAAGQPAVNPQVNPQINPQANPQAAASLGGMTAGAQPITSLSSLASGQANPYAGGNAAWMRDSAGLSPQQKSRMWGTTPGFYTS